MNGKIKERLKENIQLLVKKLLLGIRLFIINLKRGK
jgi:hypothetical protein